MGELLNSQETNKLVDDDLLPIAGEIKSHINNDLISIRILPKFLVVLLVVGLFTIPWPCSEAFKQIRPAFYLFLPTLLIISEIILFVYVYKIKNGLKVAAVKSSNNHDLTNKQDNNLSKVIKAEIRASQWFSIIMTAFYLCCGGYLIFKCFSYDGHNNSPENFFDYFGFLVYWIGIIIMWCVNLPAVKRSIELEIKLGREFPSYAKLVQLKSILGTIIKIFIVIGISVFLILLFQ